MKKFLCLAVSVLGLFLGGGNVCAEPGITRTEIHLGGFGPMSGPAAMWGDVIYGSELVYRLANDQGGINGRKIVFHWFDDAYNPARTIDNIKKLQNTKPGIFAWQGGVGTATGRTLIKFFSDRNIPWIGPFSGSEIWVTPPRRNLFALYPHYSFEAKVLCRYALEVMNKKKISIVYQNDDYGKSGLKGAGEEMAMHNLNLLSAYQVDKATLDMTDVAARLKKDKAEVVLVWLTPFGALRLLSDARKEKYFPQWMSTSTLSDFTKLYNLSHGLIKGLITTNYADFSNVDLLKKYRKGYEKYYLTEEQEIFERAMGVPQKRYVVHGRQQGLVIWGMFFHGGIAFAEPVVEALKRCGRDVTRERFIHELENLHDFQGVGPRISFKPFDPNDPDCRQGTRELYLVQCGENGLSVWISDWITE